MTVQPYQFPVRGRKQTNNLSYLLSWLFWSNPTNSPSGDGNLVGITITTMLFVSISSNPTNSPSGDGNARVVCGNSTMRLHVQPYQFPVRGRKLISSCFFNSM